MAKTKRDTIIEALLAQGFTEIQSRSKYRTFQYPDSSRDDKVFVGKAGAVRFGRVASKSVSLSHTAWVNENLLANWKK